MSILNHGRATHVQSPATQPQHAGAVQAGTIEATDEELQRFNEDAAAARHLTAIRIRGQLAEFDEGQSQT